MIEKIQEIAQPMLQEPIVLFSFFAILTYIAVRDYQTKEIKNKANLFFLSIGALFMGMGLVGNLLEMPLPTLTFGWSNVGGMLIGFFALFLPAFVKNQPMGGDIKASLIIGFWLGYEATILVVLTATILNLLYWCGAFYIWKDFGRKTLMPMAPFLALGAICFYGFSIFL